MTETEYNSKFASFFINEIMPRQKKSGIKFEGDLVAALFVLMQRDKWPRKFVREFLDFSCGIPRKNSTLEEDHKYLIEMFNYVSNLVKIVEVKND